MAGEGKAVLCWCFLVSFLSFFYVKLCSVKSAWNNCAAFWDWTCIVRLKTGSKDFFPMNNKWMNRILIIILIFWQWLQFVGPLTVSCPRSKFLSAMEGHLMDPIPLLHMFQTKNLCRSSPQKTFWPRPTGDSVIHEGWVLIVAQTIYKQLAFLMRTQFCMW